MIWIDVFGIVLLQKLGVNCMFAMFSKSFLSRSGNCYGFPCILRVASKYYLFLHFLNMCLPVEAVNNHICHAFQY